MTWILVSSPACSMCSCQQEDILHCLRECPHSKEIWCRLEALAWPNFMNVNLRDCILSQLEGLHVIFAAAIWKNHGV